MRAEKVPVLFLWQRRYVQAEIIPGGFDGVDVQRVLKPQRHRIPRPPVDGEKQFDPRGEDARSEFLFGKCRVSQGVDFIEINDV